MLMGYPADASDNSDRLGHYFLRTNPESPYGMDPVGSVSSENAVVPSAFTVLFMLMSIVVASIDIV